MTDNRGIYTPIKELLLSCMVVLVVGLGLCAGPLSLVQAATFIVDRSDDDATATACKEETPNDCSLRGAIIKANGLSEASTINVPAGTYVLTQGTNCTFTTTQFGINLIQNTTSLCFAGNITLIGAGATTTIIDGNHTANETDLVAPVMFVGSNAPVEIRGVTITKGNFSRGSTFGSGGGMNNAGVLTIVDSIISDNFGAAGGGIYNSGTLTLLRSRISRNLAGGGAFSGEGGGIYNVSSFQQTSITVTDSIISANTAINANGGGISNFQGIVTITNSTVHGNTADRLGGGIANFRGTFTGTLTVTNATISGNRGSSGGGIYNNSATVHLQNVTIAHNIATTGTGGGINNPDAGTFTLRNTLIVGNTTGFLGPDCFAPNNREAALISQGYNLIQNTTNCDISGDTTGNITGQDPQLGVLANNGGLTPTQALLAGSPAIDTGNPNLPGSGGFACPTIDQRGVLRPQGTACDIGAYETESFQGASLFIVPNHAGNTGPILAIVYGSDVVNGATVKLKRAGQDIVGDPVAFAGTAVLSTSFDLTGQPTGPWDVVVSKPDGTSATIPGGFTIEDTRAPQVWADVIGRTDRIRVDRPERYTILFGNRGNVDAVAASLVLTVPTNIALHLRFQVTPPPAQAGQVQTDWSQVPIDPAIDGLTYVPLLLPVLPAGFTGTLEFTVTAPSASLGIPFEIRAEIGLSSLDSQIALLRDGARSYALNTLGVDLPPSLNPQLEQYATTQLQNPVTHGRNAAVMSANTSPEVYSLPQLVVDLAQFGAAQMMASVDSIQKNTLLAANTLGWSGLAHQHAHPQTSHMHARMTGWVGSITHWLLWFLQPSEAQAASFESCERKGMGYDPRQDKCIPNGCGRALGSGGQCGGGDRKPTPSTSGDPNDKVGALGVGTAHYLAGGEPLRYAIFFENMKTADLPAQEVAITDELDSAKVDFATFSLGPISFGDHTVIPPPGLSQYSTSIDLRPERNLLVAIQAGLDKSSGLVTWRFTSVDPETLELTDDPEAGFLPPNTNPPEGDGSVPFTIQPKVTGTPSCNQASIVFDTNDPIHTPEWCNTIDDSPPSSHVLPLAATQSVLTFAVQWTGSDTGSGILGYTIFVSTNSGPFTPFVSNTTDTAAMFTGELGKTYAFYSVARDLVGNEEAPPTTADTSTIIGGLDQCPNDPNKTEPGVCGCGVADTDSDKDGTPDCHDACPSDPNKIAAGLCGCGIVDPTCQAVEVCGNCQDDDGDGLIDLLDPDCPSSALSVSKGTLTLGKTAPDDEKVSLTGTLSVLPTLLNPPLDGALLSLSDADGQIACFSFPPGSGWMTKTGPHWKFNRNELSLKYNAKKESFTVKILLKEITLSDPDAGQISTSLQIGTQGFLHQQEWRTRARGKLLVTP